LLRVTRGDPLDQRRNAVGECRVDDDLGDDLGDVIRKIVAGTFVSLDGIVRETRH
jgi:hypothetical protein